MGTDNQKIVMRVLVAAKLFSSLEVPLTEDRWQVAKITPEEIRIALDAGVVWLRRDGIGKPSILLPTTKGDQLYEESSARPQWLESGWMGWLNEVLTGMAPSGDRTEIVNPAVPSSKRQDSPRTDDPLKQPVKQQHAVKRSKKYRGH